MSLLTSAYDQIKPIKPLLTPVINKDSWRFAGLSATELLPCLQQHLSAQNTNAQWQLVWLNNDGKPVIGLLPKMSWSVYFHSNQMLSTSQTSKDKNSLYKVIKTYRDQQPSVITDMSYIDWQDELISYSKIYHNNESLSTLTDMQDKKSSYHHGLIGFIGYDIAAHELSPIANIAQASQPCAVLGHYDIYLTPIDHKSDGANGWQLNMQPSDNEETNSLLSRLISYLNKVDNKLTETTIADKHLAKKLQKLTPLSLSSKWHKDDYEHAFAQTQRYLQQGDCYQINLTQAWQGCLHKSNCDDTALKLLDYLPSLYANTQAPFAGYLALNALKNNYSKNNDLKSESLEHIDFELLSCSPELFFTFIKDKQTGQHYIRTKPIKGTTPRSNNAKQDLVFKQQLINSDKDRSENVMIVDLLRNDLGKYAKTGSVKVPQLFAIESFSNVHHMVSTITAELKDDTHPLAVLFGSLPAGSITGTPKKRAVEIISELENAPRGAYCGTMGYMNFDGSGQWNVLIRTLQSNRSLSDSREVSLWAGGGITIASDCNDEYQECLDKVGNLLAILQQAN